MQDLNTLQGRLDAVQEMTKSEDLYHGTRTGYTNLELNLY